MRLISLVAPSSQQAMAELRSRLGEDAVIVTSQTLANGDVRITGAIDEKDVDLASVLMPSEEHRNRDWLTSLAEYHEWPTQLTSDLLAAVANIDGDDQKATLTASVRASFSFDTFESSQDRPILLSGPSGAGKTAMVAKLAAQKVLAGESVDVLTTDTERAGAVAQLRTLLEPLGIELKVSSSAAGDAKALLKACSSDLVLIDCPGTNPNSSDDLGAVSNLVGQFDAELLLVLEAGRSPAESAEIGQSYTALGARRMIVTKLDMTKRLGGLLTAARSGLAFCGAGIGPTIGDGFRPLTASGMARLLLCRSESALAKKGGA